MKCGRRKFLQLAGSGIALPFVSRISRAATYPDKPVRIVIPFPVGGSTDVNARIISSALSERWGQQIIVDPRPGGNTLIGTGHVAKSPPDGQTLLLTSSAFTVNPAQYTKLPYDPLTDLVPITVVSVSPQTLVASRSASLNSLEEVIARAKATPRLLNYGSSDPSAMFTGQLFNMLAGTEIENIPYKGAGPLMIDILGGHVMLGIGAVSSVRSAVASGDAKLLGVGSLRRTELFPEAPSISTILPGFESIAWFGLFAPRGTPKDVLLKIQEDVGQALRSTEIKKKMFDLGAEPGDQSGDAFAERIRVEIDKWKDVARKRAIKPEE